MLSRYALSRYGNTRSLKNSGILDGEKAFQHKLTLCEIRMPLGFSPRRYFSGLSSNTTDLVAVFPLRWIGGRVICRETLAGRVSLPCQRFRKLIYCFYTYNVNYISRFVQKFSKKFRDFSRTFQGHLTHFQGLFLSCIGIVLFSFVSQDCRRIREIS